MANLCQTDYEVARPTEYFPETFRDGTCDACGEDTFVARVRRDEVVEVLTRPLRDVYAAIARRGGVTLRLTENCGYQDGPAVFVRDETTRRECSVERDPASGLFLVCDRSGEVYSTDFDVEKVASLVFDALK